MGSQIVLTPYRSAHEMVVDGKIVKGLAALMEEYAQVLRLATSCKSLFYFIGSPKLILS